MTSSTFDSAALWSATPLATDQNTIGSAGLSVRQRKLLTLLSQPMSVSQLASSIALPTEEVHVALDRFAKLGLARSGEAAPLDPMQLRAASSVTAAAAESPSRMPMMIGIAIAVLALVAAGAWMLRGGSSGGGQTPTQVASSATTMAAKAPTPTGSVDSADTVLPKGAAVAPVPAVATVAPATTPAQAAAAPLSAAATRAAAAAALAAAAPAKAASATPAPTAAPVATKSAAQPAAPTAPVAAAVVPAPTPAPALTPAATPAPVVAAPAAVATAPTAAPAAVAPARTAAAAAAPARATPAPAREIKLVNRVEPMFPRSSDADKGTVRARLQVDAKGSVTGVEILESNPPRVFDRTVRSALQQWRYEPTGEAFSTLAEISFSR